jgi:hypothetical protein
MYANCPDEIWDETMDEAAMYLWDMSPIRGGYISGGKL